MNRSAFVLGGTGLVGTAVALRLAESGYAVTVGSRGRVRMPEALAERCRFVLVDRCDHEALRRSLGAGVELFVDVIPYDIKDGEQLLGLKDLVGAIIAISSASVYSDEQGRSLDEAMGIDDFPRLPDPIPEEQPTVAPGDANYSTRKAAIERLLLEQDDIRITVLRPCAIYGPGDTQSREWFFVKRALDRQSFVLLAFRGQSVFHTTSVLNLAELVRLAAENPGTRVLNCGDPDPPSVLRIAGSIANAVGHEWAEILVPASMSGEACLRNPWATPRPFIIDMSKARSELGYEPVTTYEQAIVETVEWVVSAVSLKDWRHALPRAAEYMGEWFDYESESTFVHRLAGWPATCLSLSAPGQFTMSALHAAARRRNQKKPPRQP